MERLRWYASNALVGFLDWCMGLALMAFALRATGVEPQLWHLALGALCALLPDMDIVMPVLRGRVDFNHRETLMHRPALVLSLVALASYALGGTPLMLGFLACTVWHFVHDTMFGSIAWLWPRSHWMYTIGPQVPDEVGERWLEYYWHRPTVLSVTEILGGIAALIILKKVAPEYGWVATLGGIALVGTLLIAWFLPVRTAAHNSPR